MLARWLVWKVPVTRWIPVLWTGSKMHSLDFWSRTIQKAAIDNFRLDQVLVQLQHHHDDLDKIFKILSDLSLLKWSSCSLGSQDSLLSNTRNVAEGTNGGQVLFRYRVEWGCTPCLQVKCTHLVLVAGRKSHCESWFIAGVSNSNHMQAKWIILKCKVGCNEELKYFV